MKAASLYNRGFYAAEAEGVKSSARRVVPWLMQLHGNVRSVVDVGCGVGIWLAEFRRAKILDTVGVDGMHVLDDPSQLLIPEECFVPADLSLPLWLERKFDLVLSLEVAEHLPAASAHTFVETLTKHGDLILFSAAIPGQGGTHHVNEQWQSHWIERFKAHGFHCFDYARPAFWLDRQVERWYRQNMLLFARNGTEEWLQESGYQGFPSVDVVHPEVFSFKVTHTVPARVKPLVRALPRAMGEAMARRLRRLKKGT